VGWGGWGEGIGVKKNGVQVCFGEKRGMGGDQEQCTTSLKGKKCVGGARKRGIKKKGSGGGRTRKENRRTIPVSF